MTSDTAKPEVKSEGKSETFRSHLPAIVAATTGTILAATLGSLIGTAGTIAGMVIGSMASGTCSWWAERGIRRSTALASARAEALRARGRQLHPGEDATATQDTAVGQDATATQDTAVTQDTGAVPAAGRHSRPRPRPRWAGLAAVITAAFIGCAVAVTLVEGASGKPLSAMVQGMPGHGTTLGGGAVAKAAPARPSPTPPASTAGAAVTSPASSTTAGTSSSPAASTATTATAPSSTPASSVPASSVPNSTTPSATPTVTAGG